MTEKNSTATEAPRVAGATLPTATAGKKEKAPKPTQDPKPEPDKKNGVTRPSKGTTTGRVWEKADELSAKLKRPATREEVVEACGESMNSSTIATQYGKWRRYYGLPRVRKAPEEKAEAPEAAKNAAPTEPEETEAELENDDEETEG